MTTVSIIGIGNMGSAITSVASAAKADVQVVARDLEKAQALAADSGATVAQLGDALTGDIVVLALPYGAVAEVLDVYREQLAGRVVVDITNPVDFSSFDGLVVPADGSAAAEIQASVPGAKVVKAFNTNFASTLATGTLADAPTTVLVAGDDEAAKSAVVELVTAGGLRGEDAGSLKRARELESLGFLQITLAAAEKIAWTGGFAVAS